MYLQKKPFEVVDYLGKTAATEMQQFCTVGICSFTSCILTFEGLHRAGNETSCFNLVSFDRGTASFGELFHSRPNHTSVILLLATEPWGHKSTMLYQQRKLLCKSSNCQSSPTKSFFSIVKWHFHLQSFRNHWCTLPWTGHVTWFHYIALSEIPSIFLTKVLKCKWFSQWEQCNLLPRP